MGRHRHPGGLLEAGAREEHAARELAELLGRALAQPHLADDGRDELGTVPGGAQSRDGARDVRRRLDGVELVDQPHGLGGQERVEFGQFHDSSVGGLALTLHECQNRLYTDH